MANKRDAIRARKLGLQGTMLAGFSLCAGFVGADIHRADAATFYLGDVTVTLQSTLGYNVSLRTAPVNNTYTATLNSDDGDRNFRSGVFENRVQTLEQLGVSEGDYGFRGSVEAWLDTAYLGRNKNNSPETFNSTGVSSTGFTSATIANEGRRIEPLAAFIYGAEHFDNDQQKLSWQLGRQTITWGQGLFTTEGIAGLQAPLDYYAAQTLANPQAQALFLPTGAASLAYDFGNGIQAQAYWQFEYEPDILPGVGSYFSSSDAVGPGGQRLLGSTVGGVPLAPGVNTTAAINRAPDQRPANGMDQFGFSAYDQAGNYNLGAYFVQGITKGPNVGTDIYASPADYVLTKNSLQVGTYALIYSKPTQAAAVSVSTVFHQINLASEADIKFNQPLLSAGAVYTPSTLNYNNQVYASGKVFVWLANGIYITPPMPIFTNGGTVQGEVVLDEILSIDKNRSAIILKDQSPSGSTREGGSTDWGFTPQYFPRSDLEVDIPMSYSVTFLGNSAYGETNAGTATIDVGLKAIYKANFNFGITYQRYAGPANRDASIDRDYAQLYFQKTF